MLKGGRQRAKATFIALGACVVCVAITLHVVWIVQNWRTGVLLVLGMAFFAIIITGVVLNTIFLVREIRRNEHHDAFINAVTHELKTPVASMRLYLQTLQSREVDEARRRQFYEIMLADSDRLMTTIEQVLRAARTASAPPVFESAVDVSEIARECVEVSRLRYHLGDGALSFVNQHTERLTVMGDADELKAAISNLLDNAVKYSGSKVHVRVEVAQSGGRSLVIRVTDSGVGLPSSELKRIFKRFYRVPNAMALRVKGTGLGLFIVRSVAERHGGRVWAESEGPGMGSTFVLELPLASAGVLAGTSETVRIV